ncbi:MAG: HupE/UreJ family protein [Gemmatimonadota bacterium]|nr:HupE/UreJ family protein [Gemmatimonadota bacterium]
MKTMSRGLVGLASILLWPAGLAAHQLDSGSAGFWEGVLHLFTSPDHLLALVGAAVVGGLLWRVRTEGRRSPFGFRARPSRRAVAPRQ